MSLLSLFMIRPNLNDPTTRALIRAQVLRGLRAGVAVTADAWSALSEAERDLLLECRDEVAGADSMLQASMLIDPELVRNELFSGLQSGGGGSSLVRDAFHRAQREAEEGLAIGQAVPVAGSPDDHREVNSP